MIKQWGLSGTSHPQKVTCWFVGAMWVFAWAVELLFVWTILSWEVFATLFSFPLLPLFPVSDAVGAPPKCSLLGWCILPMPTESIGWVIHSCFFLQNIIPCWKEPPQTEMPGSLSPAFKGGPRPKTKTDMKLQKTDAWLQTVCVIHALELPVGSGWSWTPADIHSLISSFSS